MLSLYCEVDYNKGTPNPHKFLDAESRDTQTSFLTHHNYYYYILTLHSPIIYVLCFAYSSSHTLYIHDSYFPLDSSIEKKKKTCHRADL